MLFSVATPVYNSMPELRTCVGSVRGQRTSATDLRIQHIVQDGNSSDDCGSFLKSMQEQIASHPPHYQFDFEQATDQGMYDAINRAWSKADGDVLSWLNADEQYLPGTLQRVYDYFSAHPEIDAVFGNMIIIDSTGQAIAARREIPLRRIYVQNGFLYAISCTTFYRRTLLEQGQLILDDDYRYVADADLVLRLLQQGVRFGHINEYLALFGVQPGRNLSFHPAMQDEIRLLQKRYKAASWRWIRKAIMAMRHTERLLRGCYAPTTLSYEYAINEEPAYESIQARGIGSRFSYSRIAGEASCSENG